MKVCLKRFKRGETSEGGKKWQEQRSNVCLVLNILLAETENLGWSIL